MRTLTGTPQTFQGDGSHLFGDVVARHPEHGLAGVVLELEPDEVVALETTALRVIVVPPGWGVLLEDFQVGKGAGAAYGVNGHALAVRITGGSGLASALALTGVLDQSGAANKTARGNQTAIVNGAVELAITGGGSALTAGAVPVSVALYYHLRRTLS